MTKISTTIKDDNLRFLAKGIGPGVVDPVIEEALDEVVILARRLVRKRTGATERSIRKVGRGVQAGEAALWLEFGTRYMGPFPFLRPAFDEVMESLPRRIADRIRNSVR